MVTGYWISAYVETEEDNIGCVRDVHSVLVTFCHAIWFEIASHVMKLLTSAKIKCLRAFKCSNILQVFVYSCIIDNALLMNLV